MPIPACTQPVTITEENWTTQARHVIISYLDEYGILWIFYEIMQTAAPEARMYTNLKNAAKHVDEIEKLQNADFLSQHELASMFTQPVQLFRFCILCFLTVKKWAPWS